MADKTQQIELDTVLAGHLAAAVRSYAAAAYPPGGSECAQVAFATLNDVARQCVAHPGGPLALRRRHMPMLRAALRWYAETAATGDPGAPIEDLQRCLGRQLSEASSSRTA